jgi:hypothetical protein
MTALALFLSSSFAMAQVDQIGFDLSGAGNFSVGQAVDLTLQGTNWTSDTLEGGGVTLNFNSAVLKLDSITLNGANYDLDPGLSATDPVNPGDGNDKIDNVNGTATQEFFALLDNASGGSALPFSIATYAFTVVGSGKSALTLSADPIGFADAVGNPPVVNFAAESISVSGGVVAPVPEPPTLWLLTAGAIVGLFVRRRRAGRQTIH